MPIHHQVYTRIVAAKVYMDEHFHEPIDLDSISRQACLSRYHFHRLFTRIYRTTPHQYLTRRRVEQARLMLAGRDLTVSEICNHVGFESIGSFSVLFKKENGELRSKHRLELVRATFRTLFETCSKPSQWLGFLRVRSVTPQYYRKDAWLKKQQALEQPRAFIPQCFIDTCRLDAGSSG